MSNAAEPRLVKVDVSVRCRACSRHTELAGPVLQARCKHCSAEIAIPPASWGAALSGIDERSAASEGSQLESHHHKDEGAELRFRWSAEPLACRECRTRLPLVEGGSTEPLRCACGAVLSTFPAPPWLRAVMPTAQQVYGVDYVMDAAALDPAARRWSLCLLGTPKRLAAQRELVTEIAVQHALIRQPPKKIPAWVFLLIAVAVGLIAWQCSAMMQKLEQGAGGVLDGT